MPKQVTHIILIMISLVLAAACAKKPQAGQQAKPAEHHALKMSMSLEQQNEKLKQDSAKALLAMADLKRRHEAAARVASDRLDMDDKRLYSFSVKRMGIQTALATFARKYGLNIIPDKDVSGRVTVSFSNLSLSQAMNALLEVNGYYFEKDGDILRVHNLETRIFEISYPRFVRSGEGNVETSMTSASNTGSSGTTGASGGTTATSGGSSASGSNGGSSSSSVSIRSSDSIDFWGELETNLKALLSEDSGKYTINRLSGIISVTDRHKNMQQVARYLDWVNTSVHRQVVITAQIIEVSRNDTDKFAVDWERVTNKLSLSSAVASVTPFGIVTGTTAAPTLLGTYQNNNRTFKSIVEALKEQGNLRIVSKPQVRTINNQPAIIKVGTDRTFFRVESVTDTTTAGSTTTTNDIPQNITVGLVMSITPQISADGRVTLDISPVITSLSGEEVSAAGSKAPILDIKQVSSVVSVDSGQPVIIGGLIKQENSRADRKIPLLGDIPLLGGLFRGTHRVKQASELVIFITPYVI